MIYDIRALYDIFRKIDDIVSYYNGSNYNNRKKKLYLASSGMYINYSVPNKVVPHLLGINTNYLMSTRLFRSTSSYEILEELLAKGIYWLNTQIEAGIIKPEYLFSDYIDQKLECFKENIKCDMKNIEFVTICDRNKIINDGKDVENYDYIIISKINDKYNFLGIIVNEDYKAFPASSQLYDSFEELIKDNEFRFKKQDITYITSTTSENYFNGYNKSYYLRVEDKKIKINKLKKYSKIFNSTINVFHDYQYSLSKYSEFVEGMADNKGLSSEELITKLNSARAEIVACKELIESLTEQIKNSNEEIKNLKQENKEKEEIIANVRKLVK